MNSHQQKLSKGWNVLSAVFYIDKSLLGVRSCFFDFQDGYTAYVFQASAEWKATYFLITLTLFYRNDMNSAVRV